MSLTKKQTKYYKPLILKKLEEMGVKQEIGYTQTGTSRVVPYLNNEVEGEPKVERKKVPNYRASNLYKSLTKKLLKMPVESIEKFLSTEVGKKEEEGVLIEETTA